MKTRDLIIVAIAAGQRQRRLKSIREIAAAVDAPSNTVKEYFSKTNGCRLENGDLVEWEPSKSRTLRLKNAVIVRENGATKVGRWEVMQPYLNSKQETQIICCSNDSK